MPLCSPPLALLALSSFFPDLPADLPRLAPADGIAEEFRIAPIRRAIGVQVGGRYGPRDQVLDIHRAIGVEVVRRG